MMFNSSRREREEREVYEKALKLLQRAAGISGETTDDIKNFVFDIYINGKVLSSLKASYPQYSLSDIIRYMEPSRPSSKKYTTTWFI